MTMRTFDPQLDDDHPTHYRDHSKWTEQSRVEHVMKATGCDADTAREYLLAEEGDEVEAITSYRADRLHEGAMR